MSSQDQLDDLILNSLKPNDLSQYSFRVDVVPNILDQWRQNFRYALRPDNPAFVDATLSYQDILVWGYTLQYNQNGILWRVDAAGRPHPDDYHKFLEQNRIIQRATERTIAEIKPLLETSQIGQASSQSQPNSAESSTAIQGSSHAIDPHLQSSYRDSHEPPDLSLKNTFSAKGMDQADNQANVHVKFLNLLRDETWGYFSQRNFTEPYTITGGNQTIASSGCAITVMAMAVKRLLPQLNDVTPLTMAKLSIEMKTRTRDAGTHQSFYGKAAEHYHLSCEPTKQAESIQNALQNSNAVVIAAMNPGHFSRDVSGHIVLIVGKETMNGVDYYKIFDPNDVNDNYYRGGYAKDGAIVKTIYPGVIYAKTSVVHAEADNYFIITKPASQDISPTLNTENAEQFASERSSAILDRYRDSERVTKVQYSMLDQYRNSEIVPNSSTSKTAPSVEQSNNSGNMIPSSKVVDFIAEYEDFKDKPYRVTPNDPLTIGYGHTIQAGEDYSDGITKENAKKLLLQQINQTYAPRVNRWAATYHVSLTQQQFDALVSFVYNMGDINEEISPTLIRVIKSGNATPEEIKHAFGLYRNGADGPLLGLVLRRRDEADMFLYGDYRRKP